jgi:hypothetical protein
VYWAVPLTIVYNTWHYLGLMPSSEADAIKLLEQIKGNKLDIPEGWEKMDDLPKDMLTTLQKKTIVG